MKNEINIKPLRVWSDDSINGAIILGFIAQLFISLMRDEFEDLKHTSTKFIKKSLKNLTLTIKFKINGVKNYIFANFDWINSWIVAKMNGITYIYQIFINLNKLSSSFGIKKKGNSQ